MPFGQRCFFFLFLSLQASVIRILFSSHVIRILPFDLVLLSDSRVR